MNFALLLVLFVILVVDVANGGLFAEDEVLLLLFGGWGSQHEEGRRVHEVNDGNPDQHPLKANVLHQGAAHRRA